MVDLTPRLCPNILIILSSKNCTSLFAAIQSVLSIYDTQGKGFLDCSQVPDALRALGLNPTLGFVEKIAGSVKQGKAVA